MPFFSTEPCTAIKLLLTHTRDMPPMLLMPHMVVIAHKMVCGYSYVSTYGYGGHCISAWMLPSLIPHTHTAQTLMLLTTHMHILPTNHNGLFPVLPLSRRSIFHSLSPLWARSTSLKLRPHPKPMLMLSSLMFTLLSLMLKALLLPPILAMLLLLSIVHIKTWRQTILISPAGHTVTQVWILLSF